MKLLDLSLEVLREILVHAVVARGLKRALRLRTVCKLFSSEVLDAIFTSRILESHCGTIHSLNSPLVSPYVEYRVRKTPSHAFSPRIRTIVETAEILCLENDALPSDKDTRQEYVKSLCSLAVPLMKCWTSIFETKQEHIGCESESDPLRHLFVAAAYTNSISVCRRTAGLVFQRRCSTLGKTASHRRWSCQSRSSVFGCAFDAAAQQGNHEIIEILFDHLPNATRLDLIGILTLRSKVVKIAAKAGHLETVAMFLSERWGPWTFPRLDRKSPLNHTLYEALLTPNKDIFQRVMEFLQTTPLKGPLLGDYSCALLSRAAANNRVSMLQYLIEERWYGFNNSISQVVCRNGYKEVVRLLLAYNPEPICWHGSVSSAAAGGHLDLVRMLVEQGHDINEASHGAPPPIVSAIELEHTAMFQFLREHGAVLNTAETGTEALKRARTAHLESMLELLGKELGPDVNGLPPAVESGILKEGRCYSCRQTYLLKKKPGQISE